MFNTYALGSNIDKNAKEQVDCCKEQFSRCRPFSSFGIGERATKVKLTGR
jgi:hypothetical protein